MRPKALQNYKRPSMDEFGVPTEPWKRVFERNQRKYNMHLLTGTKFAQTVTKISRLRYLMFDQNKLLKIL